MTGIPKTRRSRSQEAKAFEVRIVVNNRGRCVIQTSVGDGSRYEAQSIYVEATYDSQSTATPIDVDFTSWCSMSVEDRTRLLESYVHEVLRDSGFLDVVAGAKA